jgi:hypothetical protein
MKHMWTYVFRRCKKHVTNCELRKTGGERVENMSKTCVQHCKPNCKINSHVSAFLQHVALCYAYVAPTHVFRMFVTLSRMVRICCAYVLTYVALFRPPRTVSVCVSHVFHILSTYFLYIAFDRISDVVVNACVAHVFYNSVLWETQVVPHILRIPHLLCIFICVSKHMCPHFETPTWLFVSIDLALQY